MLEHLLQDLCDVDTQPLVVSHKTKLVHSILLVMCCRGAVLKSCRRRWRTSRDWWRTWVLLRSNSRSLTADILVLTVLIWSGHCSLSLHSQRLGLQRLWNRWKKWNENDEKCKGHLLAAYMGQQTRDHNLGNCSRLAWANHNISYPTERNWMLNSCGIE